MNSRDSPEIGGRLTVGVSWCRAVKYKITRWRHFNEKKSFFCGRETHSQKGGFRRRGAVMFVYMCLDKKREQAEGLAHSTWELYRSMDLRLFDFLILSLLA